MNTTATPASVWTTLRDRLDPREIRPKLRPDIVVRQLETRHHDVYYMLKSPQAGTYLRLSPREYFLVNLMDGERTVKDLVFAYFFQYRSMAFNRVVQVVELLHTRMFLTSNPTLTYTLVREELRAKSWRSRLGRLHAFVMRSEIAVPNTDGFVTALYRAGARFLFLRPLLVLFAVIAVLGLARFLSTGHFGRPDLARAFSSGLSAVVLVLGFFAVLIFLHEMAHALTCKHFGREVRRGGFTLFFGFPAFFVDTTDIWLESRPKRIAVSAAGTFSDSVIAGTLVLVAPFMPPDLEAFFILLAGVAYFDILLNLVPLLELDGYYVLVDLLEMPMLRARAFRFVRESLLQKIRRREPLSHDERILASYGVVAGAFSLLFFVRSVGYFEGQVVRMTTAVVEAGNWLLLPALIGIVVGVGIPLGTRLWFEVRRIASAGSRGARAFATAAEHARRRSRIDLLHGIPFLTELPAPQLELIAATMRPRHFRAGTRIIRQGERGDSFFLILRGSAEVVRSTVVEGGAGLSGTASESVASLGRGDYFGEMALLLRAPRAATVRALTDLDVFELAAQDFDRLVAPTWQLKERLQQGASERDSLMALDLFKDLRPSERDVLLTRLQVQSFEAGDVIIRQGDVGEHFYVVRDGRVEAVRALPDGEEEHIATLGRGEFFGELALLHDAPRNATVRAQTPVQVWCLGRRDFDELLLRFLRLGGVIETAGRQRMLGAEAGRAASG